MTVPAPLGRGDGGVTEAVTVRLAGPQAVTVSFTVVAPQLTPQAESPCGFAAIRGPAITARQLLLKVVVYTSLQSLI